jgi:hypothetical protein
MNSGMVLAVVRQDALVCNSWSEFDGRIGTAVETWSVLKSWPVLMWNVKETNGAEEKDTYVPKLKLTGSRSYRGVILHFIGKKRCKNDRQLNKL